MKVDGSDVVDLGKRADTQTSYKRGTSTDGTATEGVKQLAKTSGLSDESAETLAEVASTGGEFIKIVSSVVGGVVGTALKMETKAAGEAVSTTTQTALNRALGMNVKAPKTPPTSATGTTTTRATTQPGEVSRALGVEMPPPPSTGFSLSRSLGM